MKTEIIQYEPIHAYEILTRNVREQDVWLSKFPGWYEYAEGWKNCGPAFTLVVDGEIVASAGITILKKGVGEAWSLLSSLFYNHKIRVYREMKHGLDRLIAENNLHRVQALCFKNLEKGCHLLEHLGFVNETPEGMKCAGPNGEDVYLFARTKQWPQQSL